MKTDNSQVIDRSSDASNQQETNYSALSTLTTVFFFWGFIASGNTVFIPFCKEYFGLDQFQSQLIDFAFYGAYYLGALTLFLLSSSKGKDIVGSWGYKKTIVIGLIFSAFGAGAMILSVYNNVFSGMLLGLFIVALGFSLQQTSANPFMIILGDERTGSTRITLGGAVNSFGTMVGPLIISLALFRTMTDKFDEQIKSLGREGLDKVSILYGCVGLLFLFVALLFRFSKNVPDGKIAEEGVNKASDKKAITALITITGLLIICFSPVFYSYSSSFSGNKDEAEEIRLIGWLAGLLVVIVGLLITYFRGSKTKIGWGAMQYPQLTLGMLAIFIYVGVEVAIGSNLGELLQRTQEMDASEIAPYVSMYWGSLMIGRWTGAVAAFNLSKMVKQVLRFIVPLIAFGITLGIGHLWGYNVAPLKWYFVCVLIQIIAFYLTQDKPALTLGVFGILGAIAITIGVTTSGMISVYAFLSGGLFCSIMWPCIFSLALAGLGKYQTQGSAFLVMMILGGAIIPPLQGKLADFESISIQFSFVVGIVCFIYLAFFAFFTKKKLKNQGVDFE
jgi:FHS family L-fucose permease-like MFS transporter